LTVTDAAGRTATASRTVTVSNETGPPPLSDASFTATITRPTDGVTITGTYSVGLATTAPWGQPKTWTLTVDGQTILSETTTGTTLWFGWNSASTPDGDADDDPHGDVGRRNGDGLAHDRRDAVMASAVEAGGEPLVLLAGDHAYAGLFVAAVVDAVGLPFPGRLLLIGAGVLAPAAESSPTGLVVAAALGALVGDHAWYVAGRFHDGCGVQRRCQ
jgi:hypothetical protein